MNARDIHFLAIDNGTQSVRAIVIDPDGEVVAVSKVGVEPYFSLEPGYAEQDVGVYVRALTRACERLWDMPGVDRAKIKGVAVTTQRATVVPVDHAGKPLRAAITWMDQRQVETPPPMHGPWPHVLRGLGLGPTIDYFRKQAECNWIAVHEPDVFARTHKYLLLSGYLTHLLTGRFADSIGSQVGYLPFEYRKLDWAAAWSWQWRALTLERQQLPDLVKPGRRLGTITPEASALTGIPEGLPVIAAGADKACEVLGSGCITPDIGAISYGTTATVNAAFDRYVEPSSMIPPYPAAIPDGFNTEVQVFRGFWMVEWFKREFGAADVEKAKALGVFAEQLFEEQAREIPPGSMGLVLQPYWTPGIKEPGREAKGAIIGFGDVHKRGHVYRAILEGLAYGLREGRERIEKRGGVPMRRVRVSGGGSQSDLAMQITADVFGLPAERPHTFETSALGAAMATAVGLGVHVDFPEAVRRMTRVGKVFSPNPAAVRTYDAIYQRVYAPMYGRLKPLYLAIKEITGYPA